MIISILLVFTNVLNIILEFFNKSISILLWGILLIIFTIPHVLIYNTGKISTNILDMAGLFVIFFNLIYLVSRIILNKKIKINFRKKLINNNKIIEEKKVHVNLFFCLYVMSVLVLFYGIISKGYSLLDFTWTDGITYKRNFLERVASFAIAAFSGIGFIVFARKEKIKLIIVSLAYISYVLLTRSRYNIIPFIIPFLIYYIYSGETKKVLKSAIIGVLILFSVFLLQQIRYAGSISSLINNYTTSEIVENTFLFMKSGKGEFGLSKVFYYFVENNNNFNNFGEGRTYARLILLPFPSSIFTFKPRDFAMDMWEAWMGMKTTTGTMHPTLYGDVYANFGFLGVFMGVFYALFVKINDSFINRANVESKKILYISIFSTMYILLARGAVYNSIANAFWSIVFVNIIIFLLKLRYKRKC